MLAALFALGYFLLSASSDSRTARTSSRPNCSYNLWTRLTSSGDTSTARFAFEEALCCRETGEEKVILTALCGHGHLDLAAYGSYLGGEMVDRPVVARARSIAAFYIWVVCFKAAAPG